MEKKLSVLRKRQIEWSKNKNSIDEVLKCVKNCLGRYQKNQQRLNDLTIKITKARLKVLSAKEIKWTENQENIDELEKQLISVNKQCTQDYKILSAQNYSLNDFFQYFSQVLNLIELKIQLKTQYLQQFLNQGFEEPDLQQKFNELKQESSEVLQTFFSQAKSKNLELVVNCQPLLVEINQLKINLDAMFFKNQKFNEVIEELIQFVTTKNIHEKSFLILLLYESLAETNFEYVKIFKDISQNNKFEQIFYVSPGKEDYIVGKAKGWLIGLYKFIQDSNDKNNLLKYIKEINKQENEQEPTIEKVITELISFTQEGLLFFTRNDLFMGIYLRSNVKAISLEYQAIRNERAQVMFVALCIFHEMMHQKRIQTQSKGEFIPKPEKYNKETGEFIEQNIFGIEFMKFSGILEVVPKFSIYISQYENWRIGFINDYISKQSGKYQTLLKKYPRNPFPDCTQRNIGKSIEFFLEN